MLRFSYFPCELFGSKEDNFTWYFKPTLCVRRLPHCLAVTQQVVHPLRLKSKLSIFGDHPYLDALIHPSQHSNHLLLPQDSRPQSLTMHESSHAPPVFQLHAMSSQTQNWESYLVGKRMYYLMDQRSRSKATDSTVCRLVSSPGSLQFLIPMDIVYIVTEGSTQGDFINYPVGFYTRELRASLLSDLANRS